MMRTASSDDNVDDGRMEIYKDEYVSVYFGLTIWWGKKQGSQGAHCTLCIAHYTRLASHIISRALHIIHDLHIEPYIVYNVWGFLDVTPEYIIQYTQG